MTRDAVSALMQRWTEAIGRHDVGALSALYALDCKVESPMAAGQVQGRQAIAKVYHALFDAFPDLAFTPETIIIEGGAVAMYGWMTGTYTGGFLGLPPNGKLIRVPAVTISTVSDDQIAEERRVYDFTGMLVQIGVLQARPG